MRRLRSKLSRWKLVGLAASSVFLHSAQQLSASSSIDATNVVFTALWQFESDSAFEDGATRDGKVVRLFRSGADKKRGTHGEVSRFQILPRIWREYSDSRDYTNPELSWSVAERILADRKAWFEKATGRKATPFDLYAMWNAPGYYHKAGFSPKRLNPTVKEKAERFSNLVERFSSEATIIRTAKR